MDGSIDARRFCNCYVLAFSIFRYLEDLHYFFCCGFYGSRWLFPHIVPPLQTRAPKKLLPCCAFVRSRQIATHTLAISSAQELLQPALGAALAMLAFRTVCLPGIIIYISSLS